VRLRLIRDGSPALARLAHGSRARWLEPHRCGNQPGLFGVHVQGRIRLRLRHAAMGCQSGSRVCAAPLGAPVDGAAQTVSLSVVVPYRSCKICSGDAARPSYARASLPESERGRGGRPQPSKGKSQLHYRDSPAPFAGVAAPAFRGCPDDHAEPSPRHRRKNLQNESIHSPSSFVLLGSLAFSILFAIDPTGFPRASGCQSSGSGSSDQGPSPCGWG
jgi:hypothetical protein